VGFSQRVGKLDREYACSKAVTKQHVDLILSKNQSTDGIRKDELQTVKQELKNEKILAQKVAYKNVCDNLTPKGKRCLELSSEKGASSWLTALPLENLGYSLNKQEFRNAIKIRYNWSIPEMPNYCACGSQNSIDHALSCKKGGYPILRHNAIRDVEAMLMKEAGCVDVRIEPGLLECETDNSMSPRTNIQPNARLDISARGIFGTYERTFCDVRVTHPNCPSNVFKPIDDIYKEHEAAKRKEYEERVRQTEKGSFVPLIMTTSGGMGPALNDMNKRLAQKICDKRGDQYSYVINHIRTRVRFALMRGILIAILGERGRSVSEKSKENELYNVNLNLIPQRNSYQPR